MSTAPPAAPAVGASFLQRGRPLAQVAGPGVMIGLVTALVGLDRKSFWLDEAYTLGAVAQLGETLRETSGTMAAYYVLVTPWSAVSDSVAWMRLLSVLIAVASLAVVGRLAERLVGREQARLVVVANALSYLWMAYAREARSYALVLLLTSASWLAFDHAIADDDQAQRDRWWRAHLALAAVLPLAHGLALLQILPQVLVAMVAGVDRRGWHRVVRSGAASLAVTIGLLTVGAGSIGRHVPTLRVHLLGRLVERFTSPYAVLSVALLALLVVGTLVQIRTARRATDPLARARALTPVAWALVPVLALAAISVLRPAFLPRYVIGVVPGMALLRVAGVTAIAARWRQLRVLAPVALVVVLVVGQLEQHLVAPDEWEVATEVIAHEARDGDAVLFGTIATRPPFEAAWRDIEEPPSLDIVGSDRPLGRVLRFEDPEIGDVARWERARDHGRMWVVGNPGAGESFFLSDLVDPADGRPPTHRIVERRVEASSGMEIVLLARV